MSKIKLLLIILSLLLLSFFGVLLFLNSPVSKEFKSKEFEVKAGETAKTISLRLYSEGFIRSPSFFQMLCRFTGSSKKLQKGLYLLNDNMSSLQIMDFIIKGKVYTVRITIPEGWPVVKISKLLAAKGLISSTKEFNSFCFFSNVLKSKFSFLPERNLEGFLYPDTYDFPKNTTVRQIASTMVSRFSNKILNIYKEDIRKNKYSLYEILKLASLIEKEARVPQERFLISQVFHLRLKKNMALFCDPTVAYAVGKHYGERLSRKDLNFDSPFNTYIYTGLPPTPICNPGISSFEAALKPANTDYLYFVSKNDGTHFFSKTLKEHNEAVKKYQLKKKN